MTFQKVVFIVAAILLILSLIVLAILIYNSHGGYQWPPEIGECPDYWTASPNLCTNTRGLGTCGSDSFNPNDFPKGKAGNKERCKIAKECGLTWDGITNADYC